MNDFKSLTGRLTKSLVSYEEFLVSPQIIDAFINLKNAALIQGIDIKIASAYRSYERQEKIWNDKVLGKRPILNEREEILDIKNMDEEELLFAMAKYSAIPGASRHHWGTELDVYDLVSMPSDYKLKLLPSEYKTIFLKLNDFLTTQISSYDFIYPFTNTELAYEPWHISHKSSRIIEKEYTFDIFKQNIQESHFLLKNTALKKIEKLYQKYFNFNN